MPGTPPPERLIITDRTATDISLFCSIYMLLMHNVQDDALITLRESLLFTRFQNILDKVAPLVAHSKYC